MAGVEVYTSGRGEVLEIGVGSKEERRREREAVVVLGTVSMEIIHQ